MSENSKSGIEDAELKILLQHTFEYFLFLIWASGLTVEFLSGV